MRSTLLDSGGTELKLISAGPGRQVTTLEYEVDRVE
jgi:hypothetical protein